MANSFDIDVNLNTSNAQRQLNQLNSQLRQTTQQGNNAGNALGSSGNQLQRQGNPALANFGKLARTGGIAIAALGAASIAATAAIVRSQMDALDSLAKTADQIDISVEALQAWRFAAEQTGASASVLDSALLRMDRRLGQAAQGTGAAVRGIEELGMSADDLIAMGTEEAFRTIAQSISELPTQTERAAAAYRFFGNQGQQLLGVLNEGAEGLSAFQQRAEELGLTVSRLDLARIEEANDTFNEIRTVFTGLAQQFTVEIMPLIQMFADEILGATEGIGGMQEVFRNTARVIAVGVGAIRDGFAWVRLVIDGLINGFDMMGLGAAVVFRDILAGVENMVNSAIGLINSFIERANNIRVVNMQLVSEVSFDTLDAVEREIDQATARIQERSQSIGEELGFLLGGGNAREMLSDLNQRYAEADANAESLAENAEREARAKREGLVAMREAERLEQQREEAAKKAAQAAEEAARYEQQRSERVEGAIEQLQRRVLLEGLATQEQRDRLQLEFQLQDLDVNSREAETLRTLNEQLLAQQRKNELLREQEQAIGDLGEAMGRWAVNGKDAIAGVIAQLIQLIAISQFGGTGNFLGGLLQGAGQMRGFANGGRPPMHRASVVGERGPELFVPDSAGRIIPNEKITFGGGGQQLTVQASYEFNGNIYGVDDLQAEMDRNNQQIAAMFERQLLKQARTGGLYGR